MNVTEKNKEYQKKYRKTEKYRLYIEMNKEQLANRAKEWVEGNKDKVKAYVERYQKTEKYKDYRKKYETEYRKRNRAYENFRSTKSRLYKKHGEEIGALHLAAYVMRQKAKGIDLALLLPPSKR